MTWNEMIASDNVLVWAAGLAGAAAMAATDWQTPRRAARHFLVGGLASLFATPLFFPMLSKVMSSFSVPEAQQGMSAGFFTGAFAIYFFEYCLAFWRAKVAKPQDPKVSREGDDND